MLAKLNGIIKRASVDPAERKLAGAVAGWLFVLGGATFMLFPLLPGHVNLPWLLAIGLDAVIWGLVQVVLIPWERAPAWLIHASLAWSFVLIGGAIASTGGLSSSAWAYFFFSIVVVSYFFPRPYVYAYIVAAPVVHALPLLYGAGQSHTHFLNEFVIAAPAYVVFGIAIIAGKDLMRKLRDRAEELAWRQSALRRVATAVVDGRSAAQIYELVALELATLHSTSHAAILRVRGDGFVELMGRWAEGEPSAVYEPGTRFPIAGTAMQEVLDKGCAVLNDTPPEDSLVRQLGLRSSLVAPVTVGGHTWGILSVSSREKGVLTDADVQRVSEFGDLLATAITSIEDRAKLTAQASTDPLTGLANHRAFQERMACEASRAERHRLPLSVAIIDVDNFKQINDIAGHETGDAVLVALSRALQRLARAEDLLGRLGGDEFVWLMPETGREQALIAVERARLQLSRRELGGHHITVSAGICDISSTHDPAELLRFADGALYWSKAHGRNQCWIYDPEIIEELSAQERAEHLERSQALLGLRALARAIDAKDPATREHSERVSQLVGKLALAAGWGAERARLLSEAALVHDVGKIGVADAILSKLQPLTDEERGEIFHHAELSARIVEGVLTHEQVEWIRMHHERPDGAGYPDGLEGDQILEGAALLSVADAFDVMTVSRPYSTPKPLDEALGEVERLIGMQFTESAAAALRLLYARGELALQSPPGAPAQTP